MHINVPTKYPLFTIKTDPFLQDWVITAGSKSGIYVSANTGNNWSIPSGNYNSLSISYYKIFTLGSTIYIVGSGGNVAKSSDHGLSFNLLTTLPTQTGQATTYDSKAVYFTSPTTGVVANGSRLFKTVDGGSTWTALNSGNPLNLGGAIAEEINGLYVNPDGPTIVVHSKGGIFKSEDGGISFTCTKVYAFSEGTNMHVLIPQFIALGQGGSILKSTDLGSTWTTTAPFSNTVAPNLGASLFTPVNGYLLSVPSIYTTQDTFVTKTFSDSQGQFDIVITDVTVFIDQRRCYYIVNCKTDEVKIVSSTTPLVPGLIIKIDLTDNCWGVADTAPCNNWTPITVLSDYAQCSDCLSKCYLLTDCSNASNTITTNTDLGTHMGKVIKIRYCDTCWIVSKTTDCLNTIPIIFQQEFTNCAECLPIQSVNPFILNTRTVSPGYNTPGCSPEYFDNVNCDFGEANYNEIAELRFGVKMCCDLDVNKLWIKKWLLDMAAIFDPNACIIPATVTSSCPTVPDAVPTPRNH